MPRSWTPPRSEWPPAAAAATGFRRSPRAQGARQPFGDAGARAPRVRARAPRSLLLAQDTPPDSRPRPLLPHPSAYARSRTGGAKLATAKAYSAGSYATVGPNDDAWRITSDELTAPDERRRLGQRDPPPAVAARFVDHLPRQLGEKTGIHNPDLLAQLAVDSGHNSVVEAVQE
jgi:hypothetical protein